MPLPPNPTALIAEDEPLLAAALQAELACAWPELQVLSSVGDGVSAVRQALQMLPDVLFFDIRMPGMSGLEAAAELAETWNTQQRPFPALVFVTAYDTHAVQAFEAQAIDYLLKPVQPERLRKTVEKVRIALSGRALEATVIDSHPGAGDALLETTLTQLRQLLTNAPGPIGASVAPLKLIQASVGNRIQLVPIDEVVYFEAADKYLRVLTAAREYLIRTPLKDLLPQLDASVFWQIHRSTVVNAQCIDSVTRDEAGKIYLSLRGLPERLTVSRLYAHQFKAM
jgi:DNA-binding LytR/AlgR family response regulator